MTGLYCRPLTFCLMCLWKTYFGTTWIPIIRYLWIHSVILSLFNTHAQFFVSTYVDIPPFFPSITYTTLHLTRNLHPASTHVCKCDHVNVTICLLTTLFGKVTAVHKVLALKTVLTRKVKNQLHPAQSWFCNSHKHNAFNDSVSALQKRTNPKLRLSSLYYPLRVLFCHFCRSTEEVS